MLISLIILLILIAGVGVFKLLRGLRGGRIGDEPRCRRCDYQLQGIESLQCPECGLPLSPSSVVRGKRYRRPSLATAGLLGLLVGLGAGAALAYVQVQQIDWITFRPTSWLIDDLSSTNVSTQQASWRELDRRISGAGISQHQTDRLVDACLAMQAQSTPVPTIFGDMADAVSHELLAGKLTDARRNAFLSHLMRLSLVVRPKAAGTLPYSINEQSRGPNHQPFWYSEKTMSTRIDGKAVGYPDAASMSGQMSGNAGGGIGGSVDLDEENLSPGPHVLQVECRLRFHTGSYGSLTDDDEPFVKEIVTGLNAPFIKLPPNVVDPVKLLHDPSLGPALHSAIHLTRARLHGNRLSLSIDVQACPVDVAFDVFAVARSTETKIASVYFHKGGGSSWYTGGKLPRSAQPIGKTVDIVLRSSPDAARKTIDMTQIWDGELRFTGVPFVRS